MKTVPLHGKIAAGRVALVDDEDYDLVMQYRWNVHERPAVEPGCHPKGPYAVARIPERPFRLYMHKLITGWARTDHEDHDGLNNQRSNLRRVTNSQNLANQRPRSGLSSQFKGVSWDKKSRRWFAYITVNGRMRSLGRFGSEEYAARVYDVAAIDTWGAFACTNFTYPDLTT